MKKVAIVGVEGSGKTVMLAGLGELYSQPDENGLFMSPKNFATASYVAEKIERMRHGAWPVATAEDVLQGLDWTLKQKVAGERPKEICEISCLDFAGEVYRAAFGIRSEKRVSFSGEVSALRKYVREANEVIVLVNLRDVIVNGIADSRVQESIWITKSIIQYALDTAGGREESRVSIVLTQADSYAETIRACGGPKEVLEEYLRDVANNYDWIDVIAVSAVDRTILNGDGNPVPPPDFSLTNLRPLMTWVCDGLIEVVSKPEEKLPVQDNDSTKDTLVEHPTSWRWVSPIMVLVLAGSVFLTIFYICEKRNSARNSSGRARNEKAALEIAGQNGGAGCSDKPQDDANIPVDEGCDAQEEIERFCKERGISCGFNSKDKQFWVVGESKSFVSRGNDCDHMTDAERFRLYENAIRDGLGTIAKDWCGMSVTSVEQDKTSGEKDKWLSVSSEAEVAGVSVEANAESVQKSGKSACVLLKCDTSNENPIAMRLTNAIARVKLAPGLCSAEDYAKKLDKNAMGMRVFVDNCGSVWAMGMSRAEGSSPAEAIGKARLQAYKFMRYAIGSQVSLREECKIGSEDEKYDRDLQVDCRSVNSQEAILNKEVWQEDGNTKAFVVVGVRF